MTSARNPRAPRRRRVAAFASVNHWIITPEISANRTAPTVRTASSGAASSGTPSAIAASPAPPGGLTGRELFVRLGERWACMNASMLACL